MFTLMETRSWHGLRSWPLLPLRANQTGSSLHTSIAVPVRSGGLFFFLKGVCADPQETLALPVWVWIG
jgi:hypothetical protein